MDRSGDVVVAQPSGTPGSDAEPPVCKCGAAFNVATNRCARGHVLRGNTEALVVGQHSNQFWLAHEDEWRATVQRLLVDFGYPDPRRAPATVLIAADSIAQATLIRDSAFLRLADQGGPTTDQGRIRRTVNVWMQATDRIERLLRVVGLPKPGTSPSPSRELTTEELVEEVEELARSARRLLQEEQQQQKTTGEEFDGDPL